MVAISSSSESQQLSAKIATVLDTFPKCQNVATKNNFIHSQVSQVNSVHDKFRKLTEQSIPQADRMALYMNQLANYAKFVANPDVVDQDSFQGARSLLRHAKKNKQLSENFASKYQKTIDDLRNIREALEGYTEVINQMKQQVEEQEDEVQEYSKAGETKRTERGENIKTIKNKIHNTWKSVILPTSAGIASVVVATELIPVVLSALALELGAEFFMDKVFDVKDAFGVKSTRDVLLNSWFASFKTAQIARDDHQVLKIQKSIQKLRDQLDNSIQTVNYLCSQIQAIINNLTEFEGFWASQQTKLEYIISTFEASNGGDASSEERFLAPLVESLQHMFTIMPDNDSDTESTISRFDAIYIQGLCSNLEFKCMEYSRITRGFLNRPVVRIE